MSHRRVDRRGRYGNEAIALKGDEPMRREGLQARGIYKEVPRPSRRLGLATRQKIPYSWPLNVANCRICAHMCSQNAPGFAPALGACFAPASGACFAPALGACSATAPGVCSAAALGAFTRERKIGFCCSVVS